MKNLQLFLVLLILSSLVVSYQSCTPDPCKDIVCLNGGTCDTGDCDCPDGFSGVTCEIQDFCFGVTCEYDGVCLEGTCECTEVTANYLLGNWDLGDSEIVVGFLENGIFTIDGQQSYMWSISEAENSIDLRDDNNEIVQILAIQDNTISCENFTMVDSYVDTYIMSRIQ